MTIVAVRHLVSRGMCNLAKALAVPEDYDNKLRESYHLFRGGEGRGYKFKSFRVGGTASKEGGASF